jgi:hypothetical protein
MVIQATDSNLMTNMAPVANHEYVLQEGHINVWKHWYINSRFPSQGWHCVILEKFLDVFKEHTALIFGVKVMIKVEGFVIQETAGKD